MLGTAGAIIESDIECEGHEHLEGIYVSAITRN